MNDKQDQTTPVHNALRVESLSKRFAGVKVFSNISFSVSEGERVAIIGPNGAGKTTLINVISGVLSQSSGKVYVLGHDVTNQRLHKRSRFGLARSFQLNSIFPDLTVIDSVMIALQGTELSCINSLSKYVYPKKTLAEAETLLDASGLRDKKNSYAKMLPHGAQRQLELVLTLMPTARVILLDEPSAGLSAGETSMLADQLRSLPRSVTVLFAAHDLGFIFNVATRIVVLYRGALIADGTPEEIRNNDEVQQIYLGGHVGGTARTG